MRRNQIWRLKIKNWAYMEAKLFAYLCFWCILYITTCFIDFSGIMVVTTILLPDNGRKIFGEQSWRLIWWRFCFDFILRTTSSYWTVLIVLKLFVFSVEKWIIWWYILCYVILGANLEGKKIFWASMEAKSKKIRLQVMFFHFLNLVVSV